MECSSCLQYQLYIYRMELRRRRRREDILHETKADITNQLILHQHEQDKDLEMEAKKMKCRRRCEDILQVTKGPVTDHLRFHRPEQDEAAEVEDIKQKQHSGSKDILPETKAPVTDQLKFYPLEPEKSIPCEVMELVDTFEFNFLDKIQINEFNTNFNNVFKSDARSALEEFNDYYINF
uniref:Uncharacterized protein n=1 Tax=Bactrocera latifrons TaxID=174628 RepID=A0A0K8VHW7_BACLA